jgi:hypothetical protein
MMKTQTLGKFIIQAWTRSGWANVGKLWAANLSLVHKAVDDYAKSHPGGAFRAMNAADTSNKPEPVVPIITYGEVCRVRVKNRRQ